MLLRRGVVLGMLMLAPAPVRGQEAPAGPIIDTVIVITHDIYSPEEAARSWLYRLTNGLHVTTRQSVVRAELLFAAGEPYDPLKIAETTRNLRARGLFRAVEIDTLRIDDKLAVRVLTSDGWTTSINLNANFSAGQFVWAVGAEERNLLGTGARGGVSYRKEVDRSAFRLSGGMERIGGTRAGVDGFYDALSDGKFGVWNVGVPFRSNSDRWGLELPGNAGNQRILQFRSDSAEGFEANGDVYSREFQRRTTRQFAVGGVATSASPAGFLRFGVAAQIKREEYIQCNVSADTASTAPLCDDISPTVPDTVQFSLGGWMNFRDPRYKVVTHYNGFAREVDVDLSTDVILGVWFAPDDFGFRENGIGPVLVARTGGSLGKLFGWVDVAATGLITSAGLDSGTVVATGTLVGQFIRKNSTVLHIEGGARRGTPPGLEFDLGLLFGPRAFPAHSFTGDRMIWGTLEQRAFLIDELFGFMGLGFAAFVDYGGAWYSETEDDVAGRDPPLGQDARFGGNVGFGLRFGATRGTGPNVGRLDLAYRFGEGWSGSRWAISFGRAFPF
jgi:hypothetical protein